MELKKYIRDRKNQRIGVLVSNGYNSAGWSLCHVSKEKFNKILGLKIARGRECRIEPWFEDIRDIRSPIPKSIRSDINIFLKRTRRYFQDQNPNVVPW